MASPPEYVYSAVAQQDSVVYINDVKGTMLTIDITVVTVCIEKERMLSVILSLACKPNGRGYV